MSSDHEWLEARERGEQVDVSEDTRRRYERLQALVAELPGVAPTAGWKQRVLAEAARPVAARKRAPRSRYLAPLAVIAACAVIFLIVRPRGGAEAIEPTLTTEVVASAAPRRGGAASIGDTLVVTAQSKAPAELRVYGGSDELVASCGVPAGAGCTITRDGDRQSLRLELRPRMPGRVRSVLYIGAPMPPPGGSLSSDLAAARDSITTQTTTPVIVQ